ncbi:hypothetical protein ACFWPV_36815 [Streptomyces uncialis]|uniref:hypothetical protein n=1 Tax=Streptomyces uncialis TaxID=1048205 RepID=UPI00364E7C12
MQKDSTGVFRALVHFTFTDAYSPINFDKFDLHVRLEKYDVVQKGLVCDYRTAANSSFSFDVTCQQTWPSVTSPVTADSTLVYNLNNDGKGDYSINFHGSPSI